ncbi:MAG: DUF177 domain-containing protein [Coriobacteriales bacterium]|nr:DUF177 domain-containing protein [Coriobacteriales bacterium]
MTSLVYRVDVTSILEEHGASVEADAPFPLESYQVGEDHYTLTEPASVDATITNTGAGLVATGDVTARVSASCSRCLCEFPLEVRADIEGFYVLPGQDVDLPEEQEVEFIDEDGVIDLAPALRAAIVLETPYAPLHDPECAGICASCGADLNVGECECTPMEETEDHPFAKLKELLPPEAE